jgi:hypothetical protein
MSLHACKQKALGVVALEPAERRSGNEAAGFFFSAILHGLALFFLLFIVAPFGSGGSGTGLLSVPIEVDVAFEKSAPAAPQRIAALRQTESAQQAPSNPTEADVVSLEAQPRTDELETKLQALAELRQPDSAQSIPRLLAANGDGASGRPGRGLEDLIRAQVERRWNLDLATLGNSDFSVPIHVELTSAGVVLKAEIVDSARTTDLAYREVAVSARNAVLLSSPLSLPTGHYQGVMDMVLYLNPRDALR